VLTHASCVLHMLASVKSVKNPPPNHQPHIRGYGRWVTLFVDGWVQLVGGRWNLQCQLLSVFTTGPSVGALLN